MGMRAVFYLKSPFILRLLSMEAVTSGSPNFPLKAQRYEHSLGILRCEASCSLPVAFNLRL